MDEVSNHKEKKYSKLKSSSLFHVFSSSHCEEGAKKKIVATHAQPGLREEFKKTFLPLLIEVFELRQMIETYKMQRTSPEIFDAGKTAKTPQEILRQLTQLQNDIEESQRWCNGIILQISKGITEAQEALEILEKTPFTPSLSPPKISFFKKILKKLGFLS